jgi:hypothetical protein
MSNIPIDLLVQSLISGFGMLATKAGFVYVLLVVVIGLIGIFLRTRIPANIAMILTVGIFLLNLHIIAIFPLDSISRLLISMTVQASRPISTRLYAVVGKVFYNFGFLLLPFIISIVAIELVSKPSKKPEETTYSKWPSG